ncbi:hypothetical protein CFK41_06250 [Brachybacterium ginsengisoli]|uniref:TIGR03089 family protein n=1 Tax=Brachybacterium ginsengisoli TaxID=1331682 RepID=A0A291GW26_9MICO|nr:TIGR03089 family protein [Brachybacterium ginsengisoli]ATG54413.1 hypothetical protein CFK41_06250 [Brachybacterium ginsengisoli]
MTTTPPPDMGAQLLRALESIGPRPVLAWYGEAARIELSGHVLANWVIKSIGHLHDEIDLAPADQVILDLPPHWKRLALALACWSLGAEVTVAERAKSTGDLLGELPHAPRAALTDRPDSPLAETADEVLALEAVSLAPRYSGELPPLVHDWLAEVRGSSDRLGVALPAWSGPAAQESTTAEDDGSAPAADAPPRLLVEGDGLRSLPQVLAALLAGGGIVGPAGTLTARQEQDEAVTGRA